MVLRHFALSSVALVLVFLFQNCGPGHLDRYTNAAGSPPSLSQGQLPPATATGADSVAAFGKSLHPLLVQNCSQCHGTSQSPLFAGADLGTSHDAVLRFGLVSLATPATSRLATKVRAGHQGFAVALANEIEAAIAQWASDAAKSGSAVPPDAPIEAKFSSIRNLILIPKCVGCHSPTGSEPEIDYSTYRTTLRTGRVRPGRANESEFYIECLKGKMPIDGPMLTDPELTALRDWINQGALEN